MTLIHFRHEGTKARRFHKELLSKYFVSLLPIFLSDELAFNNPHTFLIPTEFRLTFFVEKQFLLF